MSAVRAAITLSRMCGRACAVQSSISGSQAMAETPKSSLCTLARPTSPEVRREQALDAVRTLLRWAGDEPTREGLRDTPKRVVDAYAEWFAGYKEDPEEYLRRTFEEVAGYDEMIVLRDIQFES